MGSISDYPETSQTSGKHRKIIPLQSTILKHIFGTFTNGLNHLGGRYATTIPYMHDINYVTLTWSREWVGLTINVKLTLTILKPLKR